MCKNISSCPFKDLTTRDVEIKENRNKVENLTNASNAYATLRSAGLNDTDALIATRIVSDPQSVARKNKEEKEENANFEMQKLAKQSAINSQNSTNDSANNNGSNSGNTDE